MLYDHYKVDASPDGLTFTFESVGPKGRIMKVVEYEEIANGIFNLGFGDKSLVTGSVSDTMVTNNGDTQKVLATVAVTLTSFFTTHPEAVVSATGSTPARTRLYQIGISNNLELISQKFEIYGFTQAGRWEAFSRNSHYNAFLCKQKNINLWV